MEELLRPVLQQLVPCHTAAMEGSGSREIRRGYRRALVPFSVLGKAPSTVEDENEGTLLTSTADSCILSW